MTLKLSQANVLNALFTRGEYQMYWAIYDDIDPDIYKVSYKAIVKSPYKSSFG